MVRVGGGLARSRRLVELLSSYACTPVELAGDHYDSARGAALLAALANGLLGLRELLNWSPRVVRVEARPRPGAAREWYRVLKQASRRRLWRLALYGIGGARG